MYPQKVCLMFHVLTTCVSFDYVVNCKNEWDFVILDFIVPTNCVSASHPDNHETSTGFCKYLPSQVAISVEIMEKHTYRKFYVMYRHSKQVFSERKL